jgi:hypothetical protein
MFRSLLALARTRRELGRLSDRVLRDIGVEPSEVRDPAGPSALIMQPALLHQLRDPEPAGAASPQGLEPGRPLWINLLRASAVRPI